MEPERENGCQDPEEPGLMLPAVEGRGVDWPESIGEGGAEVAGSPKEKVERSLKVRERDFRVGRVVKLER